MSRLASRMPTCPQRKYQISDSDTKHTPRQAWNCGNRANAQIARSARWYYQVGEMSDKGWSRNPRCPRFKNLTSKLNVFGSERTSRIIAWQRRWMDAACPWIALDDRCQAGTCQNHASGSCLKRELRGFWLAGLGSGPRSPGPMERRALDHNQGAAVIFFDSPLVPFIDTRPGGRPMLPFLY